MPVTRGVRRNFGVLLVGLLTLLCERTGGAQPTPPDEQAPRAHSRSRRGLQFVGMQDLNPKFGEWYSPSQSKAEAMEKTPRGKRSTGGAGGQSKAPSTKQKALAESSQGRKTAAKSSRPSKRNAQPTDGAVEPEEEPEQWTEASDDSSQERKPPAKSPKPPRRTTQPSKVKVMPQEEPPDQWIKDSGPPRGALSDTTVLDREGKVLTCGVTSAVDVAVGVLARRAFDSAKDHAQGPIITRRAKYFRTSEVSGPSNGISVKDISGRVRPVAPVGKRQRAAVRMTWLQYFPDAAFYLKHSGAGPLDLLTMLFRLRHKYPNKDWYLLAHDDTYVHAFNVLCELRANDPDIPWYGGAEHCERDPEVGAELFTCSEGASLESWINGGAGVVLSRAMVERLELDECMKQYDERWRHAPFSGADVVLACCVSDAYQRYQMRGPKRVHITGFTAGPPGFQECQCPHMSCSLNPMLEKHFPWRRMTYHGIGHMKMRTLGNQDNDEFGTAKRFGQHSLVYLYPSKVREVDAVMTTGAEHGVRKWKREWRIGEAIQTVIRDPEGQFIGASSTQASAPSVQTGTRGSLRSQMQIAGALSVASNHSGAGRFEHSE